MLTNNFILTVIINLIGLTLSCQIQAIQNTGGTTTVMIVTIDSIWIGADSKFVTILDETIVSSKNHLKIKQCKNIFSTVTGEYVSLTKNTGEVLFDCEKLIHKTINRYNGFNSAYINAKMAITNELNIIYKKAPSRWKRNVEGKAGNKLLQVVMVTNENKKLQYKSFDVGLLENKGQFTFSCVDLVYKNESSLVCLTGNTEEIHKLTDRPDFRINLGMIKETIIKLINLEIKANPDKVGGSIDVVVINKNGFRWLTNNVY